VIPEPSDPSFPDLLAASAFSPIRQEPQTAGLIE
jgi:hypothetical protein